MYKEQVRKITKDLKRTKKAIIAIGCSFVQGQGAVDDKLYQDYTWEYHEGRPLTIDLTDKHRKRLLKGNSNLKLNDNDIEIKN